MDDTDPIDKDKYYYFSDYVAHTTCMLYENSGSILTMQENDPYQQQHMYSIATSFFFT